MLSLLCYAHVYYYHVSYTVFHIQTVLYGQIILIHGYIYILWTINELAEYYGIIIHNSLVVVLMLKRRNLQKKKIHVCGAMQARAPASARKTLSPFWFYSWVVWGSNISCFLPAGGCPPLSSDVSSVDDMSCYCQETQIYNANSAAAISKWCAVTNTRFYV